MKDNINGGKYHCYASGDGSLGFVHADINGNATGQKITEAIAREIMPNDFILYEENGVFKARNYRGVK